MVVASRLGPIELEDSNGTQVRRGDLWRDQAVVLAFIRHFGWLFCRERVAQLRDRLAEIRERGAELVVVGNGSRHFAAAFREDEQAMLRALCEHHVATTPTAAGR